MYLSSPHLVLDGKDGQLRRSPRKVGVEVLKGALQVLAEGEVVGFNLHLLPERPARGDEAVVEGERKASKLCRERKQDIIQQYRTAGARQGPDQTTET